MPKAQNKYLSTHEVLSVVGGKVSFGRELGSTARRYSLGSSVALLECRHSEQRIEPQFYAYRGQA